MSLKISDFTEPTLVIFFCCRSYYGKGGDCQICKKCKSQTHITKDWIPFCEEELKPREGLEFANLEECEKCYKSYTHHVDFSVRK